MKRLLLPIALLAGTTAFSQDALTHYFPAGQTNAGILVKSYVSPLAEDIGSLATNGWYTTAATHKKWGFDFGVTMNAVMLKTDGASYLPPTLSGTSFDGTGPTGPADRIPSIYGKEYEYPTFHNTTGTNVLPFQGPDGIDPKKNMGVNMQVLPTITAGLGLFKNTDIRLRYTPQQTINDIKAGTMGVAIMHDIKQHIKGLKLVPFSMSILAGYTQTDGSIDLSGTYAGNGQEGKIKGSSVNAQLLLSKSLAIVTFYGGLGYSTSTTKFNVNGTYTVDHYETPVGGVDMTQPFTLTNPYSYSFKKSGFKATVGMRLKFGPLFLNGDYSIYNSQNLLSVGLGLTFR